eukprot:TRINITY_DN48297_c0_g1_i1.p2 TRINITY_DN48297_c0_g1~~TRINITY_DN48297_c0_g1_i1.p2  ORF type:complete len:150 (+),score=22.61 TRINITY_DN48297_c0_g1_i1:43-450(+)
MAGTCWEAAVVNDANIAEGIGRALDFAGSKGFVASLPQLLQARAEAPYENEIWNNTFTANTEETVVQTNDGTKLIVAHGGGILGSYERMRQVVKPDGSGFGGLCYGRYSAATLGEGSVPSRTHRAGASGSRTRRS